MTEEGHSLMPIGRWLMGLTLAVMTILIPLSSVVTERGTSINTNTL